MANRIIATAILMLALGGCNIENNKFEIDNMQSYDQLLSFTKASASCSFSDGIKIYAISQPSSTEYIMSISSQEKDHLVRMFKTHAVLGGYKIEGVSTDGEYKAKASVNYLSNSGTDIKVETVEHYQKGVTHSNLYKYCDY